MSCLSTSIVLISENIFPIIEKKEDEIIVKINDTLSNHLIISWSIVCSII